MQVIKKKLLNNISDKFLETEQFKPFKKENRIQCISILVLHLNNLYMVNLEFSFTVLSDISTFIFFINLKHSQWPNFTKYNTEVLHVLWFFVKGKDTYIFLFHIDLSFREFPCFKDFINAFLQISRIVLNIIIVLHVLLFFGPFFNFGF